MSACTQDKTGVAVSACTQDKTCKFEVLGIHMTGRMQVAEMTGAKIDELKALIKEHKWFSKKVLHDRWSFNYTSRHASLVHHWTEWTCVLNRAVNTECCRSFRSLEVSEIVEWWEDYWTYMQNDFDCIQPSSDWLAQPVHAPRHTVLLCSISWLVQLIEAVILQLTIAIAVTEQSIHISTKL